MEIDKIIISLKSYIESKSFKGWDPYDALNSPILRCLSFNLKYGRILWTQFMRRSVFNFRPLLLLPKGYNPKAIGLFLSSYSKMYSIFGNDHDLTTIKFLIEKMKTLRSEGYSGSCWGYNFDWQSRASFVKAYTPTLVNTAFVGHSLLDDYELRQCDESLDIAKTCANFFLSDLNRKKEGDVFCFSYTPHDNNYVHNANMLGSSFLIRLSKILGQTSLIDPAISSLSYSLKYQHDDGSWYYAETGIQKWVDSFHTGFNLKALNYFLKYYDAEKFKRFYDNGMKYYADNFFLDDGTPKYYNNKIYPIDIHAPAVAIDVLSAEEKYFTLSDSIAAWMIENMMDKKKNYFYFRKLKNCIIKIPYIRWGQAWALSGLVNYYINRKSISL